MPDASTLMTDADVRAATNAVSPDAVLDQRIKDADAQIRRFRGAHPTGSDQPCVDELTRRRTWLVNLVLAAEDNALEPNPAKLAQAHGAIHREMAF